MATEDWSKYAIQSSPSIQDSPPGEDWSKYAVKKEPEHRLTAGKKLKEGMNKIFQQFPERAASGVLGINKGFGDVGHGILQPLLESGALGETVKRNSQRLAQERLQSYEDAVALHPVEATAGNIFGSIGAGGILSSLAAPFGGAAAATTPSAKTAFEVLKQGGKNILKGGLKGAGTGAAYGAAQYEYPGESRLENSAMSSLFGAGLGAAIPAVQTTGKVAGKLFNSGADKLKKIFGNKSNVAEDVFEGMLESEVPKAIRNREAGERLGVNLTPAEATGNPLLADFEGKLGKNIENKKNIYKFKKGEKKAQKSAIEGLLKDVSPENAVANTEARDVAKSIIQKRKQKLIDKADPVYKKSYYDEIPKEKFEELLKDSNINKAYKDVLSDSIYQTDLEGYNKNSVKVLDIVKKNLDGKKNNLYNNGYNEEARLVSNSRKKLIDALDAVSPTYKKARSIYSDDLPAIKAIENSKIGRLANLGDEQAKNVSKIIFDPQETDFSNFKKIRDSVIEENPEVWRRIVRNEMERRLYNSKSLSSTQNYGGEFYRNILAKEPDFRKFYAALGNPNSKYPTPEQMKLVDMRRAFRNLINSVTAKTASGQSQNLMTSTGRGGFSGKIVDFYNNVVKGKYDKAAIEIITDKNWKDHLPKNLQKEIKGDFPKNPNHFVESLIAIQAAKYKEDEEV